MKRAIEVTDIRVGDVVEATSHGFTTRFTVVNIDSGRLYASDDVDHDPSAFLWGESNTWELIYRPTPPVELPTEPTLGWLSVSGAGYIGVWSHYEYKSVLDRRSTSTALMRERDIPMTDVTAFTPATAVPTSALEELRKCRVGSFDYAAELDDFFRAVDAAGSGA